MSKIVLGDIASVNSVAKINENMSKIENYLNDKVLAREHLPGEENQMEVDLDMNSNRIYNLPAPLSDTEPVRRMDLLGTISAEAAPEPILILEKQFDEDKVILAGQDGLSINPTIPAGKTVTVQSGAVWVVVDYAGGKGEKGDPGDPGDGESNTASNLGNGFGLFSSKSGVDLRFKSISPGSNISITDTGTSLVLSSTASGGGSGEITTASNLGDVGLYSHKVGSNLYFKGVQAGSGVNISSYSNNLVFSTVVISSVDPGNVGAGVIWVRP